MFFIPICCLLVGAAAMGKTKAETRVKKITALGPKSGIVYQVEDFPEIGAIVVRAPQKLATALFLRANIREPGKPGLIYSHGAGDPRILELVRKDFGVEVSKPAAVPGSSGGTAAGSGAPSVSIPPSPAAGAGTP